MNINWSTAPAEIRCDCCGELAKMAIFDTNCNQRIGTCCHEAWLCAHRALTRAAADGICHPAPPQTNQK
jgi:hypothetical protein